MRAPVTPTHSLNSPATVAPAWPRLNGGSALDPVGDAAAVAAGLAAAADVAVPEPGAKLRQVRRGRGEGGRPSVGGGAVNAF